MLRTCQTRVIPVSEYFAMQVVGIHEEACEVLFDAEFPGGMDLNGRWATSLSSFPSSENLANNSRAQHYALAKHTHARPVGEADQLQDAMTDSSSQSYPFHLPLGPVGPQVGRPDRFGSLYPSCHLVPRELSPPYSSIIVLSSA